MSKFFKTMLNQYTDLKNDLDQKEKLTEKEQNHNDFLTHEINDIKEFLNYLETKENKNEWKRKVNKVIKWNI